MAWFRSQDQYGKGITLNFQNAAKYKTVPGGVLSVMFRILIWCFIFLKWQDMTNKKDWRITIQEFLSSYELLGFTHKFSEPMYQNISVAIQIMPRRPQQTKSAMTDAFLTGRDRKSNGGPAGGRGGP